MRERNKAEFNVAMREACKALNVSAIYEDQIRTLCSFLSNEDVIANLPTGFGKSSVFKLPRSRALIHTDDRKIQSSS